MCFPAARLSDLHVCPLVTGVVPHVGGPILGLGMPRVLIGGLPAARVTDQLFCVGPPDIIVGGSPTVFIGGLPASRMTDVTAHGGAIVSGCPTVLICDGGANHGDTSGADQASALSDAAKNGKAFCEVCNQ